MAHQLDEVLFLLRHTINSVALRLEILQHLVDAAEHIQIGCRAHVPLVRWETEDCNGHLLLSDLLLGKTAAQEQSWCGDWAWVYYTSCMPTTAC